jgi:hypothetical protein
MIMVRLSPKALRFAEYALTSAAGTPRFDSERDAVWRAWSGDHVASSETVMPAQSRYVEVPDQVGALFLDAIEDFLARSTENAEEAADLGNDLVFLRSIEATLRSELGREPDRVSA